VGVSEKKFWYITECMRKIIDIILFIMCGDYMVLTCMFCRCRLDEGPADDHKDQKKDNKNSP
jgi:hypothetical protein